MASPSLPHSAWLLERRVVLPFKWGLLALCTMSVLLASPRYMPPLAVFYCLLGYAALTQLTHYALTRIDAVRAWMGIFSIVSFAVDALFVCVMTLASHGLAIDYFPLVALALVRGAGAFPTLRGALIGGGLTATAYGAALMVARGGADMVIEGEFLTHMSMLCGAALLAWLLSHMVIAQKDDLARAIDALRLENEYVNSILRNMSEGFVAVDGAGRITLINDAARRILRVGDATCVGEEIYLLSPPLARVIERARKSRDQMSDVTVRPREADNVRAELLVSARAIRGPRDDDPPGVACVFRDMSDVRRLEAGLIRSEKLASVGELAAGLAHELGNPLSIVKSCADYLRQQMADRGDQPAEELDIITAEVERCRVIVSQLLTLARPPDQERTVMDLAPVLRNSCELVCLRPDAANIRVVDQIGAEPLMVVATPSELASVFTNILVNAVQAIDGAGTITVRAYVAGEERDGQIAVEIADDGRGMPAEDAARIFEPFFTRREGGTGLGLSIVARILDQLGATPEVSSEPGKGTTFRLLFPPARQRRARGNA